MTNKDFIVKCIYSASDGFTEDYIYEIKNGRITYDNGDVEEVNVFNINELNEIFFSQFKLVEENEMSKFKVGDKVRVREDSGDDWNSDGEMDKYCGTIQEICNINLDGSCNLKGCVKNMVTNEHWCFEEKDLTLAEEKENMFREEDLKSGMLVEVRHGDEKEFCIVLDRIGGLCISGKEVWLPISHLDKNLTNGMIKITKVFSKASPAYAHRLEVSNRKLLWKREEVKEVTMQEIEEKYGCKVKIVKE